MLLFFVLLLSQKISDKDVSWFLFHLKQLKNIIVWQFFSFLDQEAKWKCLERHLNVYSIFFSHSSHCHIQGRVHATARGCKEPDCLKSKPL